MKEALKAVDGKKTKLGFLIVILYKLLSGVYPNLNNINVGQLPLEDFLMYLTALIGLGHEGIKQLMSSKWVQKILMKIKPKKK